MHFFSFIILVSTSFFSFCQTWIEIAPFPATERDDAISFHLNDKLYIGTGFKTGWITCNDFYAYDENANFWQEITALPLSFERQYACAEIFNGFAYVFGGANGNEKLNDLWKYNPTQNTWEKLASLPASGRSGSSSFVLNAKLYILGGINENNEITDEVWSFDFNQNLWIQEMNFPFGARFRAASCVLNNKAFLLFGKDENEVFRNEMYEYNPNASTWTYRDSFPNKGRAYASLASYDGKLIAGFGMDQEGLFYNDLYSYDINQSTWVEEPSLPSSNRRGGQLIATNNAIYYSTGLSDVPERLNETWKLDKLSRIKKSFNEIDYYYDVFQKSINISSTSLCSFKIIDLLGKTIHLGQTTHSTYKFDFQNFESGFYFLQIENDLHTLPFNHFK